MHFIQLNLEYIVIVMAFIILYLFYFAYAKDAQHSKNIRSVVKVVEDLNRELFYLKKQLNKIQGKIKEKSQRMNDEQIYEEIERSVYDIVQPLSLEFKQLQENINAIDTEIENRISALESGVKQISIPSSIHANDNEKILSLFKQGNSVEAISKELHIAQPEVEFVLKINKIKQSS